MTILSDLFKAFSTAEIVKVVTDNIELKSSRKNSISELALATKKANWVTHNYNLDNMEKYSFKKVVTASKWGE